MLLTRDGVKIPIKKMQIFLFPSSPVAKKIFLLSKLFWAKRSELSPPPTQGGLTDGNEKN